MPQKKAVKLPLAAKITIKDATEDIGFIAQDDPWSLLADYYGASFKEYRKKWERVSNFELVTEYPLQLDFELNNSCNLKCKMCTWSVEKPKKTILFPFAQFKKVAREGVKRGLSSIDFSFINEPLIRRDLPDFIRYARQEGVLDAAFNTNAMLLDNEYADALLTSGVTRIQFSFDAHSPEVYRQVRPGGNYARVLRNVHMFLEKKHHKKIEGMLTAVSFIKMSANEHELPDFIEYWKDKVDYLVIREYLSPYGKDTASFKEKEKLFPRHVHAAQEFKCNKPWQRMIVRADGTVVPCCAFFAVRMPMGTLSTQSIEEIWKLPAMRTLRDIHRRAEYYANPHCRECAFCSTGAKE